jgi:hypothetical protein
MSTVQTIEFFLRGKVGGVELTPRTIGLSQFNEFNQQVEAFVAGSQKGKQNETHVEVAEGSDYRIGAAIPWVTVEKYLFGVVEDMGGAQKANIHLRLRDTGQTVIVGASQDVLRDQPENRVYRQTLLRVIAEQHFKTGQLRNVRLLAFEDYAPSYDENALNAFADQGSQAWRDIPDAVAWVREQRGGTVRSISLHELFDRSHFDANGERVA